MIASTAWLCMGAVLIVTVRLSGNASALGLVVVIAMVLVGIGCGLHLNAMVGYLSLRRPERFVAAAGGWCGLAIGSAWALERAPGPELVAWLMVAPALIGAAGLRAPRSERWAAFSFMAVALGLFAFLVPVWLERHRILG